MHSDLIWGFLGPSEFTPRRARTASRSVRPFCKAHDCDRQTDRQTDHATPSVAIIGRIYVVLRCDLIISNYCYCYHSSPISSSSLSAKLECMCIALITTVYQQELISRWDNERERFYDDIVHVEVSAYARWTDFLSMLIYAAANQGRLSTSFIILRCDCEPAGAMGWRWFSNVFAANHLCTYAHQTELSEFVLPK